MVEHVNIEGYPVNVAYCRSVDRIVTGIIHNVLNAGYNCSWDEAIADAAAGLGISVDAVRLAMKVANR